MVSRNKMAADAVVADMGREKIQKRIKHLSGTDKYGINYYHAYLCPNNFTKEK